MSAVAADLKAPYQQPIGQVIAALASDARRGLSEAEARTRLERDGRNELAAEMPVPAWRKFLAEFTSPLDRVEQHDGENGNRLIRQRALSTIRLSAGDWLRCVAVASSVLWLRELSKLISREKSNGSLRTNP